MTPYMGISYKLSKSENFDEYMKALGVGLVTRKLGNAAVPTVTLTEKDGVYTFSTTSTFKNHVVTFKPGEEFDEVTADGRKVKSLIKFNDNKMIHVQEGEVTTTIVREFSPTQMKAVFTVGNVTCTRTYDKVK